MLPAVARRPLTTTTLPPRNARQNEFDPERFGRWLQLLLVSFYNDEEIVVTQFLLQRAALICDTVIAQNIGLTDRQVRQALERRLVPDCVVERQTQGEDKRMQTLYRVSSVAIAVAARRLQEVEDSLASEQAEEYRCPKCERSYDSLQAMALAAPSRSPPQQQSGGAGSFAFTCDDCHEKLVAVGNDRTVRHERLERFRNQCRELLLLTRDLKDMVVPQFPRLDKDKTSAGAVSTVAPPPGETGRVASGTPSSIDSIADASSVAPVSSVKAAEDPGAGERREWFRREVLGDTALLGDGSGAGHNVATSATRTAESDALLQLAVQQAQHAPTLEIQQRISLSTRLEESSRLTAALRGKMVTVQGKPYPLEQAHKDEALQDLMTDEEYQRYFDLAREVQRLASGFL